MHVEADLHMMMGSAAEWGWSLGMVTGGIHNGIGSKTFGDDEDERK